jgi:hypothetical protein
MQGILIFLACLSRFLSWADSNSGHSSDVDIKMQIPYLKSAIKAVRVSQLTKREKASYLPLSDFYNDA